MTTELDDPHVEERLADLDRRLKSLEAVLWPTGRARTDELLACAGQPAAEHQPEQHRPS